MTYKIKTTKEKVEQGEDLVRKNGGKFYSDGTFEVSGVKGSLEFSNGVLLIEITDKPWLASWDMIENKLSEFFN